MHSNSKFSVGLAVLLLSVAVKGAILAWFVPAWQQPDEPAHFQYTQLMVEEHRLPISAAATQYLSPEVIRSVLANGLAGNLPVAVRTQLANGSIPADAPDRRVYGPVPANPAAQYGPTYYALTAIPYAIFRDSPVAQRLIAMRLVSVLLFLGVVYSAYRTAFLLRPKRGFALAVAAVVGWHPMATFVTAGVNNDVLVMLLGALACWLLVHLWRRPPSRWQIALLVVLCTVGVVTKLPFIVFFPLFAYVLFRKAGGLPRSARYLALAALIAIPLATMFLWQRSVTVVDLPGMTPLLPTWASPPLTVGRLAFLTLFYRPGIVWASFWGTFGWMSYPLHAGTYAVLLLVVGAAVRGLVLLVRDQRQPDASADDRGVVRLLALPYLLLEALYLVLFWGTLLRYNNPNFPNQGRYYFILLTPLVALGIMGLGRVLPPQVRRFGAWGLAALLLLLNVDALVVLLGAWG